MRAIDTLESNFRDRIVGLLSELAAMGVNCIVTSGFRSIDEQNKLYEQGRTTPGKIVTKARGGESPHNFRLAADLCPLRPTTHDLWWDAPDDVWQVIHNVAEQGDLTDLDSGYDWKFCDRPHIEDRGWKDVQAKWRNGELELA